MMIPSDNCAHFIEISLNVYGEDRLNRLWQTFARNIGRLFHSPHNRHRQFLHRQTAAQNSQALEAACKQALEGAACKQALEGAVCKQALEGAVCKQALEGAVCKQAREAYMLEQVLALHCH